MNNVYKINKHKSQIEVTVRLLRQQIARVKIFFFFFSLDFICNYFN